MGFSCSPSWIMCRWTLQDCRGPPEHPRDTSHTFSASCCRLPIHPVQFPCCHIYSLLRSLIACVRALMHVVCFCSYVLPCILTFPCACFCACVRARARVCACMHASVLLDVCACFCVCVRARVQAHICARSCMCASMCASEHVCF